MTLIIIPVAFAAGSNFQPGPYNATKNLNVRYLPRAGSVRINHLHKGDEVSVKRSVRGWCEIELKRYRQAWVNCSFLSPVTAGAAQAPAVSKYADFDGVAVGKTEQGNWTLGINDAKVTMEEYGDMECPFCVSNFSSVFPQIFKNYIATGKVKYVYHDFPLSFHAQAANAAIAVLCAGDQDKFWQMHEAVFNNQDVWSAVDGLSAFDSIAKSLVLKMDDFDACLKAEKYKSQIDADYAGGILKGVDGTPTFFINGVEIMGAVPYETFAAAIDGALGK